MKQEITREEAVALWAERKPVEAMGLACDGWGLIAPPGSRRGRFDGSIFNNPDIGIMFRLPPEPPAKRWRPWTVCEVPLLAIARRKGFDERYVILGATQAKTVLVASSSIPSDTMLHEWEHTLDGGKNWLPCGVEISG